MAAVAGAASGTMGGSTIVVFGAACKARAASAAIDNQATTCDEGEAHVVCRALVCSLTEPADNRLCLPTSRRLSFKVSLFKQQRKRRECSVAFRFAGGAGGSYGGGPPLPPSLVLSSALGPPLPPPPPFALASERTCGRACGSGLCDAAAQQRRQLRRTHTDGMRKRVSLHSLPTLFRLNLLSRRRTLSSRPPL